MKAASFFLLLIVSFAEVNAQIVFEQRKKVPRAMGEIVSVAAKNSIYLTGIYANERFLFSYNASIDEWVDLSKSFPLFRYGSLSSAIFLDDYATILMMGNGYNDADSIVAFNVSYNINTIKSKMIAVSPYNNVTQWMVYHDDLIFIGGGLDEFNEKQSSPFYTLNPADLTFSLIGEIDFQSSDDGIVLDDELYILDDGNNNLQWIYTYSFEEGAWSNFMALPFKLSGHCLTSCGKYILLIGGFKSRSKLLMIDSMTKTYKVLDTNIYSMGSQAENIDDMLYLIGGYGRDGYVQRKVYSISCQEVIKAFNGSK